MSPRSILPIAALVAALMLALISCSTPEATPVPTAAYLTETIPPCTPVQGSPVDPCEPAPALISGGGASMALDPDREIWTIGDYLANRSKTRASHIILRGTYLPNTVRCDAGYILNYHPHTVKEPWERLQRTSENASMLHCFIDVRVNEYIVGSGPPTLSLQVASDIYNPRGGGKEALDAFEALWERILIEGGDSIPREEVNPNRLLDGISLNILYWDAIKSTERIMFIGPSFNKNSEAWTLYEWWDIERRDDGTVIAVNPSRQSRTPEYIEAHRSMLEMTLPAFRQAAAAAHAARVAADGGRTHPDPEYPMLVTDANNLRQFFVEIGAYDDPNNPPAHPPNAYSCDNATAVPNPGSNRGLVQDCEALLLSKDVLRGTASLDWSASTAVAEWEGITVSGTPSRVARVELANESLSGTIPAGFWNLSVLTHLDLSGNSLTGSIPRELGNLDNLVVLKLSGNGLTGCIPAGLKDIATNDLSSLSILGCPPAPQNPALGTPGEDSVPFSWDALSNVSKHRVEYRGGSAHGWELDLRDDWTVDGEVPTGTSRTVTGLVCRTEYRIRVRAYGDGTTYAAEWGDPSESATPRTAECVPPTFGKTAYALAVRDDAPVGAEVGTVSATGSLGADDTVSYSISAGNEDGKFALDASTGEMTLAARLGSAAGTTYTLTVEAVDASGGAATVEVTVTVGYTCTSGTAVPNPDDNEGLVGDCKTLLDIRDNLAGTGTLNWSPGTAISSWDGVTVGGTPMRVTALDLEGLSLTGGVPPGLGVLTGLEELLLGINRLTGGIPVELGDLSNLRKLYLRYNRLTGSIPRELGDLSNLTVLWLQGNLLTGEMPPELGDLTQLEQLWMFSNLVSGPIPEELGALTELEQLRLQYNELSGNIPWDLVNLSNLSTLDLKGNSLEGCVPPSLHRVGINDLASLGLSDCTESGRVPVPSGLSATLADGTFTITWSAVTGAARYEAQHRIEGSDDDWASLPATDGTSSTYSPEDGPICGSSYEFRVRSYGDASTYAAGWSVASGVKSVTTDACNRDPEFDPASYDFEVSEDASIGDAVGTVSATDPDEDDMVSYSITADDSDGKFAIDESTGEITVEGDLDYETTDSYTLTVEAGDGNDGSATATVEISVTDVAEDPAPAPEDLSATLADGTFTITWSPVEGAARYEAQHRIEGSDDDWASLPATEGTMSEFSPEDGPVCETVYEFRVRAYGDGTTYAADWGAESDAEPVTTGPCNRDPAFDPATYSFSVSEDASTGDSVGTVSATDPDEGDAVAYSITAGNEAGKFDIDEGTGEITVATSITSAAGATYTLTVEASDGREGTATATATITVTAATCSGGIAVPDPGSNPSLVSDCETLLGLRDALAGDATLNWGYGAAMTSWDGVTVGGTPMRVTELDLHIRGLTGSIPAELGDLSNLQDLDLHSNRLTGGIPTELGDLSNLNALWLHNNELRGPIPTELGSLSNLVWLALSGNGLSGEIPAQLGGLTDLAHLWLQKNQLSGAIPSEMGALTSMQILRLQDNQLSGPIPWELGNLSSSLSILHLSGNQLEGCVPPPLLSVGNNDLGELGLPYCAEEGPVPAPESLSLTLTDGAFSLTWSDVTGAGRYEAQYRIGGTEDDWASAATTTATVLTFSPDGGPACETTYEFRVRAYGDGATYVAGWGVESEPEPVATGPCNSDPEFDPDSHTLLCLRGRLYRRYSRHGVRHRSRRGRHGVVLDHGGQRGRKVHDRRRHGRDHRERGPRLRDHGRVQADGGGQ